MLLTRVLAADPTKVVAVASHREDVVVLLPEAGVPHRPLKWISGH